MADEPVPRRRASRARTLIVALAVPLARPGRLFAVGNPGAIDSRVQLETLGSARGAPAREPRRRRRMELLARSSPLERYPEAADAYAKRAAAPRDAQLLTDFAESSPGRAAGATRRARAAHGPRARARARNLKALAIANRGFARGITPPQRRSGEDLRGAGDWRTRADRAPSEAKGMPATTAARHGLAVMNVKAKAAPDDTV